MGDVAREEKDFETKRQGLISFRARYSKQMSHTSLGRVEMIIFSMQDLLEEIRTCNFNIKTRLTSSVFVPSILFNFAEFQALLSLLTRMLHLSLTPTHGWFYEVNGELTNEWVDVTKLKENDHVRWYYARAGPELARQ